MSSPGRSGRSATMKLSETAQIKRPRQRAFSNSSTSSATSAGANTQIEDPFIFSPHQTPDPEQPLSSRQASACTSASGPPFSSSISQFPLRLSQTNLPSSTSSKPTAKSTTPCSRPIAIALPPSAFQNSNKSSSSTSAEALSTRGDVSGGYFPLHEDPEKRTHQPHPFHTATQKAKEDCNIDALAKNDDSPRPTQSSSSTTLRPIPPPFAISESQGQKPMLNTVNMSRSQVTPVTSYVPSGGFHETPMPVGKYYPSNYERRHNSTQNATRTSRNSLRQPAVRPSSAKSDTAVPQFNRTDSHGRSDSEATRQLQQYQRDMVAQAYLAAQKATQELAGKEGASAALAAASLHGTPLSRFQFPGTPHRPISPRLEPMGSPGPVTPLALEGAEGYWDRPRPVPSPDAGRESQAVARAMRAEGERSRREGQHSPAVEAGGFGF